MLTKIFQMAKFFQNLALVNPISILSLEEEEDLMLNDDLKLEMFNAFLFNLKGKSNPLGMIFLFTSGAKGKLTFFNLAKYIMGNFLGTFTAHIILQLCGTMLQFVHTQNLLGHVTAKNQNEIRASQSAREELVMVAHVLGEVNPY
jgi:hypothetical protein